jgi:hypothetical protein
MDHAVSNVWLSQKELGAGALCRETQSRQIMAVLVNDLVSDAMRLGLYDTRAERIVKANGVALRRRTAG